MGLQVNSFLGKSTNVPMRNQVNFATVLSPQIVGKRREKEQRGRKNPRIHKTARRYKFSGSIKASIKWPVR